LGGGWQLLGGYSPKAARRAFDAIGMRWLTAVVARVQGLTLLAHTSALNRRRRAAPFRPREEPGRARGKRDVRAAPQRVLRVESSLAAGRLLTATADYL